MRVAVVVVIRLDIFVDVIVTKQPVVGAYPKVVFLGNDALDEIAIEMQPGRKWRRHEVALVVGNEFHKAIVDTCNHLTIKFIQCSNGSIEFCAGMQDVDIGDIATRVEIKPDDRIARRNPNAAPRILHNLKNGGFVDAHHIYTTVRQRLSRIVCGEIHNVDAIFGGNPQPVKIVLTDRMYIIALDLVIAAVVEMHKIVSVVFQQPAAHRANPHKTVAVLINAVHKIVGQSVIDSQVRKQVVGGEIAVCRLREDRRHPQHQYYKV